jgi:ferric iron reductase protein FhuF
VVALTPVNDETRRIPIVSDPAPDHDNRCRQALLAAGRIGDFFTLDRPDLGGIPLGTLVESAERYDDRIAATGRALARLSHVDEDQLPRRAIASLVFLGISARLVAPTLAAAAIDRVVPELTLENVNAAELGDGRLVLRVTRFRALTKSRTPAPPELADLIGGHLLEGQIARLVAAFASRDALHPRLLWGNVASSVASSARLIGQHHPDLSDASGKTATLILDRTPLSGCGYLTRNGDVIDYHRRSCCLYYQFPNAGTCGDCPLPSGPHPAT